jgi:hypothetical protein
MRTRSCLTKASMPLETPTEKKHLPLSPTTKGVNAMRLTPIWLPASAG